MYNAIRYAPAAARFAYRNRKAFVPYAKAVARYNYKRIPKATRTVGKAVAGGYAANKVAGMFSKKKTRRRARKPTTYAKKKFKGRMLSSNANYAGKFKRSLKKKKPTRYEKKGHQSVTEKHGTQVQSNCAWIGFRSAISDQVLFDMAVALVRYIMYKHYGMTYNHLEQTMHYNNGTNKEKFNKITFVWKELSDTSSPTTGTKSIYILNNSLRSVATEVKELILQSNEFNTYRDSNTSDSKYRRYLAGYIMSERDHTSDTSFRNIESPYQDIENMYVKAYANASIKIQNVTAADDSSVTTKNRNRVDANPVVGKRYKFTTPLPITVDSTTVDDYEILTKDVEYILARDPNADGVIFPQVDMTGAWQRPVPQTMFKKCSGASRVRLEPGSIKHAKLSFSFDGKLNSLMHGFFDGQGDARIQDSLGTCMMFAFEKTMRTGDSNTIDINWQVQRKSGAMVKKVHKPVMYTDYIPEGETTSA